MFVTPVSRESTDSPQRQYFFKAAVQTDDFSRWSLWMDFGNKLLYHLYQVFCCLVQGLSVLTGFMREYPIAGSARAT